MTSGEKIKDQIFKHLKEGKNKLLLLENQIKGGPNYKKLQVGLDRSKKKLQEAKKSFGKFEKRAEEYIEKNPKKAVAMAAAAGVMAGALWSVFKGNKKVVNKKK